MSARVPILTYHSIDESGSPISTRAAHFARQIETLRRGGWRTAGVAHIAAALRARAPLPERTLAITFDDGYENFAESAWPILSAAGFGATLFVVSGRLGARSDWSGASNVPSGLPLLDAAAVRRLAGEGVEIGCHSATHPSLPGLPADALRDETAGAGATLAALVGGPVRTFSYPYGAYDGAARGAVARAFDAACTTHLGYASSTSDLHRLARIDAYYLADLALLERLDALGTRAYFRIRRAARRLRNRYG